MSVVATAAKAREPVAKPTAADLVKFESVVHRDGRISIVEVPPHMRTIQYRKVKYKSPIETLTVAWPWTLVIYSGSKVNIMATRGTFKTFGLDTPLFWHPMPNLMGSNDVRSEYKPHAGLVCLNEVPYPRSGAADAEVEEHFCQIANSIWNEGLKGDYDNQGWNSIWDWARLSAQIPDYHEHLRYIPFPSPTVRAFLKDCGERSDLW